jgi:uncharacterized protein
MANWDATMEKIFDPFNDRLSRDIRNTLSTALVSALGGEGRLSLEDVARRWLSQAGDAAYQAYIHQSMADYDRVLRQVQSHGVKDPCLQAVVLWNAGLFFEVHELLESVWLGTEGKQRKALGGLIQAAGVFVHRGRNHHAAAQGLARRAMKNLEAASPCLGFIEDLAPLLASLKDPTAPPPKLTPCPTADGQCGGEPSLRS